VEDEEVVVVNWVMDGVDEEVLVVGCDDVERIDKVDEEVELDATEPEVDVLEDDDKLVTVVAVDAVVAVEPVVAVEEVVEVVEVVVEGVIQQHHKSPGQSTPSKETPSSGKTQDNKQPEPDNP
jgi:hypothetical protein